MPESNMVPAARPAADSVPVPRERPPAHMLTEGSVPYWTNINPTTEEGKALIVKAHGDADLRSDEVIGQVFPTEYVLAHEVEITDEKTGEISECVRVVLIDPEGRTLSFVSEGVRRSLRVLLSLYGAGPWKPAKLLETKQVATRGGRRTFNLVVASGVSTVAKKGGK